MARLFTAPSFTASQSIARPPNNPKPQPCVKVQWTTPATRVKVNGQFVLLSASSGLCQSAEQIPQGSPMVATTQKRVKGI